MNSIEECFDYIISSKEEEKALVRATEALKISKCCENPYFSIREGFNVCSSCGVVSSNEKIFDDNQFTFQNGENNKFLHSSISELYPKSSMGTTISGSSKLARIQNWSNMPYSERVIWDVSNLLKSKLSKYFSNTVINEALNMYKSVYTKMPIRRGKNKQGIIAVCVYFSAKNNKTSVSPKQIADIMDVDITTVNKCISVYMEIMMKDVSIKNNKARDYVQIYCNKFPVEFKVQKLITKMCDFIEENSIFESSIPQNICINVFYFVITEMELKLTTIKELSEFSNVSIVTINKMQKILKKKKNYIFSRLK